MNAQPAGYHAPDDRRPRVLVIGVGNEYRGDDAAGLIVANRARGLVPEGVVVLKGTGEGGSLMPMWEGADFVIVCDAVYSGAAPGTIHRIEADHELIPPGMFRYSTHAFGVADAVELARVLQALPPRLIIYGIELRNVASGDPLSLEVALSVDQVVWQIMADLQQFITNSGGNDLA